MATTPPTENPNSGDPSEAANPATASAPAAPVRIWSSLFAGPPPSKDTRLLAAVSDHHRRLFRGRRSRLPTVPLPIYRPPILYAGDADEMAIARAILEDIVHHTLSSLHTIQEILLYWQSRAEQTRLQRMYFMACQRGPRAFVEAACGMLSRLRSNTSPFPYLLNSANCMLTTKLARLKSMKHCLAAFLAEVYSEVSKHMEGSPESSDKSLHTLFIVLNRVFPKLEASLRNASEIIPLKELFQTFKRTDELAMEQEIQQTDRSLPRLFPNAATLMSSPEKRKRKRTPDKEDSGTSKMSQPDAEEYSPEEQANFDPYAFAAVVSSDDEEPLDIDTPRPANTSTSHTIVLSEDPKVAPESSGPPRSPRVLKKKPRTSASGKEVVASGDLSTPLLDDPVMKEMIDIGSRFIGFHNEADSLEP
ncbi:hypothetical protein ACQ4PT_023220 [Festuca glaucescens]